MRGLVWSQIAQTIPGWSGPATHTQAALMAGSRHAPTARPACDTVTAEPGQSLLAGPRGKQQPAATLPHCRWRAALPAAGRPGRDDDREPARVATTARSRGEPMLSARASPAPCQPAELRAV